MQLTDEFKKPYTEKTYKTFPAGVYSFVVEAAKLHTSKKGNISIEVQLSFVKDNDFSDKITVFDYLTANPAWKFRSFLRAVGLEALENEPTVEPYRLIKTSGIAKIRLDKSDEYAERNTVQNYKAKSTAKPEAAVKIEATKTPAEAAAAQKVFITEAQRSEAKPSGLGEVETEGKDDDIPF